MNGWYYTPGWGALATVTVATVSLIASVVISQRTLRRSAEQFQQGRIDARTDKLRAEIIQLITTIAERGRQAAAMRPRMHELMKLIKTIDPADAQAVEEMRDAIRAMAADTAIELHERTTAHAYAVLMLTDDKDATMPVMKLLTVFGQERRGIELLSNGNPLPESMISGPEADQHVAVHVAALLRFALLKLGVSSYDNFVDHHLIDQILKNADLTREFQAPRF
ncbi:MULTISPECIES: hypothetical protein [unclassified Mycolicibacterium]|uniref:hypothetical protein n=1 Tax=unclassified Mycolicibacterium TaxID=2636767 RepID=UPI0012DED488|nr:MULTISPECIES: hypothetical protein [unclassified Mycolicibacterium]MUL80507.1 hypothetical protein [Mycolicibacterium sp. CBMA 329]MUL86274.1 hypothetical protein [Mycolicibacterium sp. CBMA 331]MUM01064.1 hypothetical protein [Mycolicibacterium sp. CBMA 334]MUM24958.1 hypothetical protein [Mycolicibacterium sp. CBMA 295]MUM36570.1 hypothetical protein [Mycolicibacterium sp. CBMA 247]